MRALQVHKLERENTALRSGLSNSVTVTNETTGDSEGPAGSEEMALLRRELEDALRVKRERCPFFSGYFP